MSEIHPVIKTFSNAKEKIEEYLNIIEKLQNSAVSKFHDLISRSDRSEMAFNKLFEGIKSCQDVTSPLLDSITSFLKENNSSEPFVQMLSDYKGYIAIYFQYIKDFHNLSDKLLDERLKNKKVDEIFCSFEENVNMPIECVLFSPVQHIKTYGHFIDNLENKVPPSTEDQIYLKEASSYAKGEIARMSIMFKAVSEVEEMLQNNIEGFDVYKFGRRLLFKGEATKYSRKTKDERLLLIFSDGLMIGKSNKFSKFIPFAQYEIEDVSDSGTFVNAVNIYTMKKSFCASFLTKTAKTRLINGFTEAKTFRHNIWPDTNNVEYAPVWIPDELVPNCMLCDVKFTFVNRRHHCRKCGKCICTKCCRKIPFPNASSKPQLVCDKCYETMKTKD
ncbi:FYVE zinc finger family protein [Tritrichomonas foetus]|uniref:FYVE zinc finger family protein n=1 Tax=Tritrichomonas foetus TaxID=1144522 RepID=A0A1J4KXB9_9EUKA|nr:FYVE zinc finger family protein [Tritrichomonas foetus]|eukprot:OHT14350.1 FYVE zinc finger family protein [Tritrichomonas foetus]